jgi:hypothetical protein
MPPINGAIDNIANSVYLRAAIRVLFLPMIGILGYLLSGILNDIKLEVKIAREVSWANGAEIAKLSALMEGDRKVATAASDLVERYHQWDVKIMDKLEEHLNKIDDRLNQLERKR